MNIIQKFLLQPTYKNSAQAKCYECMGADIKKIKFQQGTQKLIKNCTGYTCPIYKLRPHQ
jgi:hypothetical protein